MKKVIDNPYHYVEHLNILSKDIRNSISDDKALTGNVYALTKSLSSSEFGAVINEDMKQVCATEEAEFRQALEALESSLVSTRIKLIDYIASNDIPDSADIMYKLNRCYDIWQNYYSKKTHDESLLQRCNILRDTIIFLASIEKEGERPHLAFASTFGIIRTDGEIECLHIFKLLSHAVSESPLLDNRDCMLSDKWNTIVEFHESANRRLFTETTGPLTLNSHTQEAIRHGIKLLTPTRATKKIMESEIVIEHDPTYKMIIITLGHKTSPIPAKAGELDAAVVEAIFPEVIGKGISLNEILNKVHNMLACKECYEKNNYDECCKNRIHTAIQRFNAHVRKYTRGKIETLIKRKKNRYKIDYIALAQLNDVMH